MCSDLYERNNQSYTLKILQKNAEWHSLYFQLVIRCVCVCVFSACALAHRPWRVCRGQSTVLLTWFSSSSFTCIPGIELIIRLISSGSRHLYLLSYLVSPGRVFIRAGTCSNLIYIYIMRYLMTTKTVRCSKCS